jgi:hypothetical protein
VGRFSTRNNDGASGLAEPVDTIPSKVQDGMRRVADNHMAGTVAELYTAGPMGPADFDPSKPGSTGEWLRLVVS